MSKSKIATTTPVVAAFFVKVDRLVEVSDLTGVHSFRYTGTGGDQIADALCVPGVFDAWYASNRRQIRMDLQDKSKVHPFIFQGGGITITTTDPQLISQLSVLPADCAETKEPHPNALKALGVEVPKPVRVYPAPVKPTSFWFKRSSGTRPATGSRGSFSTLESAALDVLKRLRDIGRVALNHIDGQTWKVAGLNVGDSVTVVGFDQEYLIITTSDLEAEKPLKAAKDQVLVLDTVFGPHQRFFPTTEVVEEDPQAAELAANLAAYNEQLMAKRMADETEAAYAERAAKKPARKSRKAAVEATVTA